MIDNAGFLKESLHCEWGYVINLDKNVLEIYKGYNAKPGNGKRGRYADAGPSESGYYGCVLIKEIAFKDLKKMTIKQIEAYCTSIDK